MTQIDYRIKIVDVESWKAQMTGHEFEKLQTEIQYIKDIVNEYPGVTVQVKSVELEKIVFLVSGKTLTKEVIDQLSCKTRFSLVWEKARGSEIYTQFEVFPHIN